MGLLVPVWHLRCRPLGTSRAARFTRRGPKLLEQRGKIRVLFDRRGFHRLLHGPTGFTPCFGRIGRSHFLARGHDFGIVLGGLAGGFQLLPLLGGQRLEAVAHPSGPVPGLLHFFQGGGEARIGGNNRGIHGTFQLLVDRIACLLK